MLGYLVRGPIGGLAWHHMQYVLGLARLGHDVYFLEDSDDFPSCYDPSRNLTDCDPTYGLEFTARFFSDLGLQGRWAYHDAHTSTWLGHGPQVASACRDADLLLNLSGVNPIRSWCAEIPVRALIDTDPVFVQVRHLQNPAARQAALMHNAFFSFGEDIDQLRAAAADGLPWRPTRQPVVLDQWSPTPPPPDGRFTTVMQWDSYPAVEHQGRAYGMKSASFGPYLDLPARTGRSFELAIGDAPEALRAAGWRTVNSLEMTRTPWTYQAYIRGSKAEFSVAKHGYVASNCGWFSERTACYLASGRAAVVQDTGFTRWLGADRGVLAFTNPEEASAAVEAVDAELGLHSAAARQVAEAFFDSSRVLSLLIEQAFEAPR